MKAEPVLYGTDKHSSWIPALSLYKAPCEERTHTLYRVAGEEVVDD